MLYLHTGKLDDLNGNITKGAKVVVFDRVAGVQVAVVYSDNDGYYTFEVPQHVEDVIIVVQFGTVRLAKTAHLTNQAPS